MIPTSTALSDFCIGALLRCYRSPHSKGWDAVDPHVSLSDRDELLLRWALSENVEWIAQQVADNPRGIQSAIAYETQTNSGFISGAVDSRATLLAQDLAQDRTIFVCSEPTISPLTRRNQVLAWVLREAESLILTAIRHHKLGTAQEWIHTRLGLLERALRTPRLREVIMSHMGRQRPNAASLRDANKSMSQLYRNAAEATLFYEAIDRMEPDALRLLLKSTLIANLEDWQRLELSAALAAAEAISVVCGKPAKWKGSITGGSQIVTVGPYQILWQNALPKRLNNQLDPSEKLTRLAAEALGAGMGLARADVTVRDSRDGRDIGHLECKWFTSTSSASSAIVDAITQLVRYCRDSRPLSLLDAEALLCDSVVVVAHLAEFNESLDGTKPTGLAAFESLTQGKLLPWAQRIHIKAEIIQAAPTAA